MLDFLKVDTYFYIVGGILVLGVLIGLSLMSRVKTARAGNALSAVCAVAAILLTMVRNDILPDWAIWLSIAVGVAVSLIGAAKVKMIQMPQVVALLNGLGGLASALVAILSVWQADTTFSFYVARIALVVGFLTFTGSLVAAGKLHKLLPQKPDGVEHQNHCVEGVDALRGSGSRMGGTAAELDADRRTGELGMGRFVDVGARMRTEGGVHIPEKALADKADLGAAVFAAFFARRAVNADFAAGLIKHLLQGGSGERRGCAKEVMAAGMADAGQRVVLRQKDECRPGLFGTVDGGEAGTVTGHVRRDRKTLFGQLAGQGFAGKELVIADLGLGVDIQGDLAVDSVLTVDIGKNAVSV